LVNPISSIGANKIGNNNQKHHVLDGDSPICGGNRSRFSFGGDFEFPNTEHWCDDKDFGYLYLMTDIKQVWKQKMHTFCSSDLKRALDGRQQKACYI